MRYSGELAALGTAACFGGASNLFAAAGRRMGSHVLNRLRIPTAWIFLSLALWTIHHAWWPVWATPTALVALAISGMVGFVFGDAWGFRAIVILGPGRASLLAATARDGWSRVPGSGRSTRWGSAGDSKRASPS